MEDQGLGRNAKEWGAGAEESVEGSGVARGVESDTTEGNL